jgi:hypothetical protein
LFYDAEQRSSLPGERFLFASYTREDDMTVQTTASLALALAREAKTAARRAVYDRQVALLRPAAERAFAEVIRPWWLAFSSTTEAAQIGLLLRRGKLFRPRISENVRYLNNVGGEWEAYLCLDGRPRRLTLHAVQLRDGRPVRNFGAALLEGAMRRELPVGQDYPGALDLHPIVLIDFTEQIAANIVAAHIARLLGR